MSQAFSRNSLGFTIGVSSVSAIRLVADLRQYVKEEGFIKVGVPALLLTTRGFNSTDPRDKIFGISGLARHHPTEPEEVDYSISREKLYKWIATSFLKKSEDRFVLLSAAGYHPQRLLNIPS